MAGAARPTDILLMMRRTSSPRRAFTVTELLVVIGIIALLVAIMGEARLVAAP